MDSSGTLHEIGAVRNHPAILRSVPPVARVIFPMLGCRRQSGCSSAPAQPDSGNSPVELLICIRIDRLIHSIRKESVLAQGARRFSDRSSK